uniref:Uncharacterized protein n=1 Tax=Eutreptiella gymnastica TaxID=73025 RepID=A0A7S4FZX8_9EUGL
MDRLRRDNTRHWWMPTQGRDFCSTAPTTNAHQTTAAQHKIAKARNGTGAPTTTHESGPQPKTIAAPTISGRPTSKLQPQPPTSSNARCAAPCTDRQAGRKSPESSAKLSQSGRHREPCSFVATGKVQTHHLGRSAPSSSAA